MKLYKINAILIFLLLAQVIFEKIILAGIQVPLLNFYNEIIFLFVSILLATSVITTGKLNKILLLGLILLFYQFFQIKLRRIPISHMMQSVIYIECIIFFTYFYLQNETVKLNTLKTLCTFFKYFLYVVILFAVIELIAPRFTRDLLGVKDFDRGIGGFYFTSIFGTSTGLSQFCLLILFLYFIHYAIFQKFLFNKVLFYTVLLLGLLSFSRKEFVLILIFVILSFSIIKYGKLKYIRLIFPATFGILIIAITFSIFLREANKIALSDTYIRYQMADISVQIIKDYFPFGTGPGTFGSQMSVNYPVIYEKYGVGQNITGYDDKRGPIYDAFLFTFTSEMGIGILFYLLFIFFILKRPVLSDFNLNSFIRKYMLFSLLVIGIFSPVIMNPFGLISFSILGLITTSEYSNQSSSSSELANIE